MEILKEISTETVVAIISIVISVIAMLHSFYVSRSFANTQLVGDQLRKVIELVEYLNSAEFEATFYYTKHDGGAHGNHYTKLSLVTVLENPAIEEDFDDAVLVFDDGSNQIYRLMEFINHPLLPLAIARELTKFHSKQHVFVDRHGHMFDEQIVVVRSKVFYAMDEDIFPKAELKSKYLKGNALACQSWLSFKESSKNLVDTIDVWLKSKSVKDLNVVDNVQSLWNK